MKRLLICCAVLWGFAMPAPLWAESTPVDVAAEDPALLPGVAEVYPRLTKLTEDRAALETRLGQLTGLASSNQALAELRLWQDNWSKRQAALGYPQEWPLDQLLQARTTLLAHKDKTAQLLDEIFKRLTEIEGLRKTWQDEESFWRQWQAALPTDSPLAPPEVFKQARQMIEQALDLLDRSDPQLVALQQEVSSLQSPLSEQIGQIEQILASRKGQLLARNQPSFFNAEFYRQLDPGLFASVGATFTRMNLFNSLFWSNHAGLVVLHVLLIFILAGLIRSRGKRCEEKSVRHFSLCHPLSTGVFISTVVLGPLYRHAPSGIVVLLTAVGVLSALPLIVGLFSQPLQRRVIRLLAYVYILSLAVQSLALPAPFYSLYLAGLGLAGLVLLRWAMVHSLRTEPYPQRFFRRLLMAGMALFGGIFIAQAGGYGNLAEHLLHAGLKTVFVGLLTALVLHLLHTGMLTLAKLDVFHRQRFFLRHGQELQKRIWHLVPIVVITYAALYLMVVWRLFDSVGEAWHAIVSAGVAFGDKTVSVQMLLIGLAALYLTFLVSWLLRSLLEEEVFPRRQMDRGVRDSINKLLHYAILAFGVLMALSLAGIELKNFAVLAGALGIGIGFGLQNIVNNFVSGLILLFERPIKIGDMIVLDNEWGTVRKIGLRSTTVETFDQSEVIVPNSNLVSEKVTNWTLSSEQSRIVVPVGVAYGSNLEKVLRILHEAAKAHPKVLDTPPASAIFTAFGDSSLDFELRVWATSVSERLIIKNDLLLYIDRRFREEDVEIPFPQRDLHLRSVDDHILGKWDPSAIGKPPVQ
ncbi:small-conductance mechanosensitive ion channel [Syntrophotalea carbinolica DSM 2380]|uniref:Small-conductance mechanosensitive ion channel n=1 Tax=Syntrophotalea carbinolica (strain DSM 2380 / NBRC 103641 / GraBd1) TaxID=338963 RepID=Q3A084_SYNC1|nr:mechanosensitive ion channel domain-containing protein [Syntrophotalea carbinolica]ABA90223.1 small-conductance mechanosensitive ion channel [Syntrophotalea carbinolica DSM 2380]